MKTLLYQINPVFARHNKLPVYFIANKLKETEKAVYLIGRGTTETKAQGNCSVCGRELTHPVSVELGVGPECGKHYWDWNEVGGYTKENVDRLTQMVQQKIKIDSWVPKSVIYSTKETSEEVEAPTDHKMMTENIMQATGKYATAVTFQKTGKPGIKITFPFDRVTLTQVKTIPGRKYHNEGREKYWTAPASAQALGKLIEFGFSIDESLAGLLADLTVKKHEQAETKHKLANLDPDIKIPGLKADLMPFQGEGVSFIDARNGRALIADEMGLGKTLQALAWLQLHPEVRPATIVVPASLKLNWKKEALKFMTEPNIQVLHGRSAEDPIVGDIIIVNYDILPDWVDALSEVDLQAVVIDEIHYIKNNKAKRTKAVKKLAKGVPHVIGLSGTPITNRPKEALTTIQLIDKSIFPNQWQFLQRYCGAKHNGFGWDFNGATNTKELNEILTNSIMIRRKKADVLKDLPDKVRSFIPMELNNRKEYQRAESDFVSFVKNQTEAEVRHKLREQLGDMADMVTIDEGKLNKLKAEKASKVNILTQLEGLKQLAVKGKLDQSIKWIQDFI